MSEQIRCSNCDRLCAPDDRYCPYCHEPVAQVDVFNGDLDGVPIDYWESFIGDNADKYLAVYKANADKKWFRHFHFPAFFFTLDWLVYRKMYWQALVVWLVNVLIVFAMGWLFNINPALVLMSPIFILAVRLFIGLYAYAIYKQYCVRNIQKGNVVNGGTSVVAVIIVAILSGLITTFILEPLLLAIFL